MSDTIDTLTVPVRLSAFAVNEKDAHDATPHFAGANAVFTDQTGPNHAFLGANVNRGLDDAPAQPLEPGVHLHWALPRAFTRADTGTTGELDFRPAPNRWLISRFLVSGKTAVRRSWVVLSDYLDNGQASGQAAITLPTYDAGGQNFQYSGQAQTFDASWVEPVIPDARSFRTLTGMHLTAVASGHSTFAAFYPNCRGVFGFTDTLEDVTVPAQGEVELMYTAVGWFSDPALDPLAGGLDLSQLRERLGWTFTDTAPGAKPHRSLYHGSVQGVAWHPEQPYLPDYSGGPPTVDLDLSIGNNPPEAVSCYLQAEAAPAIPYFQVLLNAYFEGLLSSLNNPRPDQLAVLEETLHENGFQAINGDYIYAIQKPEIATGADGKPRVVALHKVRGLSLRVGDALNALNLQAQAVQTLQAEVASYQWQLFADWYRIFLATVATRQACYQIAYAKYQGFAKKADGLQTAQQALSDQITAVEALLPPGCILEQVPAPRYWRGNDPCFLLSGEGLAGTVPSMGEGGPGALLPCRLQTALVTGATANGVTVTAADFAGAGLPGGISLPSAATVQALTFEGLILNATLLGAIAGTTLTVADVIAALAQPTAKLALAGTGPVPAAVAGWSGNPWIPIMAQWTVQLTPSFATTDSSGQTILNYAPDFFTANFTIDQNNGAAITTTPSSDPASGPFGQSFTGVTFLSDSIVDGFARQLAGSDDPTLKKCLDIITSRPMAVQALSGLNAALLMQQLSLQLNIAVASGSEYARLTKAIAAAAGQHASMAPDFGGFYNPVRSGYIKLELLLVDAYGQKKTVTPSSVTIAESLTIRYEGKPVPGIAYLPPRVTQASRLLFRFLAADAEELEEMNVHPATSPICGWLLPSHLSKSVFAYDAAGASLGSLFLDGAGTSILWQSAPGNDLTIDQDVETVMKDQQPQLRDLVVALSKASATFFADFLRAVDQVNATISPGSGASDTDLAVLIGRPLVVVQTSLELELLGSPQRNQSWSVLGTWPTNPVAEIDNDFPKIEFPVVLGNLERMSDGLIGYFIQDGDAYDFANFFTGGAAANAAGGVQPAQQNTVTLTATDPPKRLLTLMDPRAAVHATTGILPTKSIAIPSDMYVDTLRSLEMTFLTAPVLRGSSGLALPLPSEAGYQWSWVQERVLDGQSRWLVNDVDQATPDGPWSYTPQSVVEGWLRLNPDLLGFDLLDPGGKAIVRPGINNGLSLVLTNRQARAIGFAAGTPGPETGLVAGSAFYIHFGAGVPQDAVAGIRFNAPGWAFAFFQDSFYGAYWAAAPATTAALDAGGTLKIAVDGFPVAEGRQQLRLSFDYYGIANLNDGIAQDTLSVARVPALSSG